MKKLKEKTLLAGFVFTILLSIFSAFFVLKYLNRSPEKPSTSPALSQLKLIESIISDLHELEENHWKYIVTNDDKFLRSYTRDINKVNENRVALLSSTLNNPGLLTRANALNVLINEKLLFNDESIQIRQRLGQHQAFKYILSQRNDAFRENVINIIFDKKLSDRTFLSAFEIEQSDKVKKAERNVFILILLAFAILLTVLGFIIYDLLVLRKNKGLKGLRFGFIPDKSLEEKLGEKEKHLRGLMDELEHKNFEHAVAEQQLRDLSADIQSSIEEERTRISREVHDILGQQLTTIKMDLSWIHKHSNEDQIEIKDKINETISLINETINTVRKISTELRPGILDDLGLIPAIEWQCSEFEKRNNITTYYLNHVDEDINFGKSISTHCFRIVQEIFTNILRHAQATEVKVELNMAHNVLILEIMDNGKGISKSEIVNTTSLGLLGIKERAHLIEGKFTIEGTENGTRARLEVPLLTL